jgi:hypothetical protein
VERDLQLVQLLLSVTLCKAQCSETNVSDGGGALQLLSAKNTDFDILVSFMSGPEKAATVRQQARDVR